MTLESLLDAVRNCGIEDIEILVVDDFSKDGTREMLQGELGNSVDRVLYHSCNKGKGAAIRTGIASSRGKYIVFQDADLEYDPVEYDAMLDAISKDGVDVVYGSRFLHPEIKSVSPFWHRTVNGVLSWFSNIFTGLNLTDMETCYKLVPSELLKSIEIEENRFGIEPELTAKLAAAKARIVEVPIKYNRRNFDEGKKIGVKDGVRAMYVILKYGLKYR